MAAVDLLASAAVKVQNVGFTWAAAGSFANTLVTAVLGGGGLWAIFKGIAVLWRIHNERAAQDDAKDAAIRKEMGEQNDKLTARVEKLEADIRDERKRCDEEVASIRRQHAEELAIMRKTHADELRALREQMDSMQRSILQWQISTGQIIALPASDHPRSNEALDRMVDKLRSTE